MAKSNKGRKRVSDKKIQLPVYIEGSIITKLGRSFLQKELTEYAYKLNQNQNHNETTTTNDFSADKR